MKKLLLHIGTHKTGATAIQHFSAGHEAKLSDRDILYPRTGRPFFGSIDKGHQLLPWTQTNHAKWKDPWGHYEENPQAIWTDLRNEINESHSPVALASSEEFDVLGPEQIDTIARALDGLQVEVICYLRRLDEFVQAYYTTDVLFHRESREIDAYAKQMRTPIDYSRNLAQLQVLEYR